MDHLRALTTDPAHPNAPNDITADGEIVKDVVNLAGDYLGKLHVRIREDVSRNIDRRLARHMRSRRTTDLAKERDDLQAVAAENKKKQARRKGGRSNAKA